MVMEKFYNCAAAEYKCNVYEFISIGEGRELTRLENMHVRIKNPNVEQWYDSLNEEGKQRVDSYLLSGCE